MTQHVRLSQFIFTYGPGAILEGRGGPRIIPRPHLGLDLRGRAFSDLELVDAQLMRLMARSPSYPGRKRRVFRVPSNAELGADERGYIYRTKPFPRWRLCLEAHQGGNGSSFYVLFVGGVCPVCNRSTRTDAVRFVRACPAGHLDDVDWYSVAHGKRQTGCTHNKWFRWLHAGGALRRVEVECPRCGSRGNMGWAWGERWPCSGRLPENEPHSSEPIPSYCGEEASIIQRQASNLRIPEIITVFSVRSYTELHQLLQIPQIYYAAVSMGLDLQEADFRKAIRNLVNYGYVQESIAKEIERYSWEEIRSALIDDLIQGPSSMHDLLLDEFRTFIRGSVEGIPPQRRTGTHSRIVFEINPHLVRRARGPRGTVFRVVPVPHLRTVAVQIGYRRMVGQRQAQLVPVSAPDPSDPQTEWYPGVEFLGEGIFIMVDENEGWEHALQGESTSTWMRVFESRSALSYPQYNFRTDQREELHPAFVWWHTLAHALIRQVSIEAGYPSPSMRERIYLELDEAGDRYRGGIIIYTTGPESECAFGGLVGLAPYFEGILRRTIQSLRVCSNDPLCAESRFRPGQYAGAACYACLFLSETSCEHRNMWLDRNVLLENVP